MRPIKALFCVFWFPVCGSGSVSVLHAADQGWSQNYKLAECNCQKHAARPIHFSARALVQSFCFHEQPQASVLLMLKEDENRWGADVSATFKAFSFFFSSPVNSFVASHPFFLWINQDDCFAFQLRYNIARLGFTCCVNILFWIIIVSFSCLFFSVRNLFAERTHVLDTTLITFTLYLIACMCQSFSQNFTHA